MFIVYTRFWNLKIAFEIMQNHICLSVAIKIYKIRKFSNLQFLFCFDHFLKYFSFFFTSNTPKYYLIYYRIQNDF